MADRCAQAVYSSIGKRDITKPIKEAIVDAILADRASQEERIREDERAALTDAKAIIGRLQTLVYNVRGWVSRGQSETAVKTMDAAMADGWTAMGWRQYLEADRARLRGDAS